MEQEILFKKLNDEAILPVRGSQHAAGLDLYSVVQTVVPAKKYQTIKTGVAVSVPLGFYGRVAPRSGLAAKFGIDVLAGVVDSDYRGEVSVVLVNHGEEDFLINSGDRIAQLVIESIILPTPVWSEDLEHTSRGAGGFGSTGI